ncbi:MAG TPA: hypothetical protein VEX60_14215 [Pyrinomonadaceae bacterium]|nr:hypothetical protein [Pyrinomonadaceae bacterium]
MAETEIWQVLTHGEIYQADLLTMKQWVGEGLVQPTDKVRKGNLNWIEAQRAPMLRRIFTGEEPPPTAEEVAASQAAANASSHASAEKLDPQPAVPVGSHWPAQAAAHETVASGAFAQVGSAGATSAHAHAGQHAASQAQWGEQSWGDPAWDAQPWNAHVGLDSACRNHPQQAATLVCRACHATFCRACPNQVNASNVLLCPDCGSFCDPVEELRQHQALYDFQAEAFGFGDFVTALRYPFKHLASLIGGALLYGFLQLAGMRGQLLATGLVFGCISLVIHRVAYGKLERDFLPDFSSFSFWDDIVVPCFLGLGVTLVTLGPILLLFFALLFGWFGGSETNPLSLTPHGAEAQQKVVKPDDLSILSSGGTAEQEEELVKKVEGMRPANQMKQQIDSAEQNDDTMLSVVRQLVSRPGLILVLALLSIGWAIMYHPMALLVAGWTESFKSVINPLVGLDTMRHMGMNYGKAFLMYLAVQTASLVVGVVVAIVTSPFNMPFVGNLPGRFLDGIVTFYTSLVIACVLGLALFKSADRLGIEID